ncbi:MAG TPA: PLP-dependent aminotransferase family protein [Candidatus Baltobacteraceae bacterium]|nr:PLP-dependent aminotransferase family protein [Candidatus Baltobacteraceae bacterium]
MKAEATLEGLRLDPRDKRPLYVQIADDIALRIERGELELGDRLPGMRELAAQLGCGLVTVSQAYESLVARGRVNARIGKGTFVAATPAPSEPFARRWEPDLGGFPRARMEGVLEQLARADAPGAISLATGHPAPETFPLAEFGRCVARTLADDPPETMQYAAGSGDPDLRAALARGLQARGVSAAASELVVCSGAQQAADVVASTLLEARAVVAAESPSYAPTLGVFDAKGASYVEIAADADGIRVDDVERVFADYRPRLFYLNPFAQNPTGAILPERRAKAIVALARRYDVVILEDQTGWVFTYDEPPPAPLAAHDSDGRVVLIESLSKTIFPALRIGYLFVRGGLHAPLESAKMRSDSFTSTLTQRALWRFLSSPAYARHLRTTKALYRERRDAFVDALQSALPWVDVRPPSAGLTLWLALPSRISNAAAFEACAREGLLVMPADPWYPTRSGPAALRLGFGDHTEEEMREAVARLARALNGLLR